MALTELDEKAALIVIDLQRGIRSMLAGPAIDGVVEHAAALAGAFRARRLPVVLVNVSEPAPGRTEIRRPGGAFPADWTELLAELGSGPEDVVVTKKRPGAFIGTRLDERLKELGVTQIFMSGVSTSMGVESTARSGVDLGYHVVFVTDAMMDREAEVHADCVAKIFPRLGETTSTRDVLERLRVV
jgi:nicotinamidase-related amidase